MSHRMLPQIIPGEENSSLQTAECGRIQPLWRSLRTWLRPTLRCQHISMRNISSQLFSQFFTATPEVLLPTQLQMVFILERCASSLPGLASMQMIWSQDILLAYFSYVFFLHLVGNERISDRHSKACCLWAKWLLSKLQYCSHVPRWLG